MTEYDSGSSSDSTSSSSSDGWSSSDSSSGYGGIDVSPIVSSFVEGVLDPDTTRRGGPSRPDSPSSMLFNPAIQALFETSGGPAQDERSLVRRIVEAERWFVPIGPDGALEQVPLADDGARRAFDRPDTAGPESGRTARNAPAPKAGAPRSKLAGSTPTTVVQVFADDPGRPARQLSGRELVRVLPADTDGVLLLRGSEPAIGLRQDELPLLVQLADSLDLEELLASPGPGQVEALQRARWYVPAANQKLASSPPGWGHPTMTLYTHPDRAEAKQHPMVELDGRALYTQLGTRGDYVALCVNPMRSVGLDGRLTIGLRLAPSFARGLARGVDLRAGAEPLPARTLAEALLWLDLEGFPWKDREIVPASRPDGSPDDGTTLIQVRTDETSNWRLVGTSSESTAPRPTLSPVFALARAEQLPASLPAPVPPAYRNLGARYPNEDLPTLTPEAFDLGEGDTQILCAGLLAQKLYEHDHWAPGCWFVSKRERLRAAKLAGWAHELLKLIPPGRDRLPRSAVHSIEGATFFHSRPELRNRDWIEQQRDRHAATATRWASFWPFYKR